MYILEEKQEFKERITRLALKRQVTRNPVKLEAISEEVEELVEDYKIICARLGERPEVGHWFFL